MKAALYTLGCKVNRYDTNAMAELLKSAGYEIVDFEERADVYIINTCTVTNTADKKSKNMIRRAYKANGDAIICVCGCLAQKDGEELSTMPYVNVVIGTEDRGKIVEIIRDCTEKRNFVVPLKTKYEELKVTTSGELTVGYIKIQEGCNNYCSYCIIPYVRGNVRSRDLENILAEAESLANSNVKEIMLTGIHISSYGIDNNKSLIEVIEGIEGIPQIKRIHLGSIEPHILTDEFLQKLSKCEKICEHFHVSLQSGSDNVLKKMNRKYTAKEYMGYINNVRKYYPKSAITTDIITGFPEETEEDFNKTCEFVKEVKFARIHVFPYSVRRGTRAEKMEQIPTDIRKKRANKLISIGKIYENEYIQSFIKDTQKVLFFKELKNGFFEGYSDKYLRVWAKDVKINECINIYFKEVKNNIIIGEKL